MNAERKKQPKRLHASKVNFLREQDGPPERELKARLSEMFSAGQGIVKAYLVRVSYGDSPFESVALCLHSTAGPSLAVIENVGKIFGSLFGSREHLDTLFVSDAQENELAQRCRPFFSRMS
jgi:SseB protein C-terminal domain